MVHLIPTESSFAFEFNTFVKPESNSKSQIQVPNPSHKFKSKKLKSKVQRKRNGTGADIIILQATHPTHNFSHLKFDLQTSMRGQNGVEFYQESNGHVGFFLALLLADQWESENPNFLLIWPTDKYEGSKWGRILQGIHWSCRIFPSPLIGRPMRGWNS